MNVANEDDNRGKNQLTARQRLFFFVVFFLLPAVSLSFVHSLAHSSFVCVIATVSLANLMEKLEISIHTLARVMLLFEYDIVSRDSVHIHPVRKRKFDSMESQTKLFKRSQ